MILRKKFDIVAEEVWTKLQKTIPQEFKDHFSRLQILIEDEPTPAILEELKGTELAEYPEELCGLYSGTMLPESSLVEPGLFPGRVYLFRNALMAEAEYDGSKASSKRLREEIMVTILHEIGHFFGLEEDDLERLGFD
jgi:predicted Zn-dependent protease with MMP-like domain